MSEVYPIFTDGKMFYHSHGSYPEECKFAYFSEQDLRTWNKKEGKSLKSKKALERAKQIYESWGVKKNEVCELWV